MMVINNINDLNETLSVHVDDRSYRYRRIMADDKVFLYFSLPEFIEILPGAWITYQGAKYTMNKPADFKKNHSRHYDYTLEFDSPAASLLKYRLRDVVERRLKFPLLANARQHLQMIVDNLNMRESGWTMGSCIETPAKLISYNHTTLAQALQMVADNFETEFEIVEKEISLGRIERNQSDPIALSYGKGNGFLPGVGRFNDVESAAIKVLHVQGGARNINRSSYGSPTLLLPASQSLQYEGSLYEVSADGHTVSLADAPAQAPEGSLDLADIYPSRVGEISQVIPVDASRNFYDFVDSSIPAGLDFNDCHMPGEKMTVIFQSGMLAGREFEISAYKHALRRFEIVPAQEDGLELPSGPFVPTVGDTYAIFGIELPAAYVREDNTQSGASWDMLREAVRYLHDNSRPKFSFTGTLDGIWAKKDWLNIGGRIQLGSYVLFSDPTFEPAGVHIRIVGIKDFVNSPESPELELSNNVISSSFTSRLAKIEQNEVVTQELHRQSLSFTKRRFQDAARTVAMLEQAFSNNFTKAISPAAIHTMAALVGDESLQYRFVNSATNPQEVTHVVTYNPSTLVLNAPEGIIQHMTLGLKSISPGHLASEYRFWNVTAFNSPPLSNPESSYYLYIKANKASMAASFALSEIPIGFEQEEGYYHLLVGILNAELAGERSYVSLYGFTEILPGRITTNKIVSADGNTFIDLQTGDIQGKFTFRSGRDIEEVVEEVADSVDAVQVGGRNLLRNTNKGTTNWAIDTQSGTGTWTTSASLDGEIDTVLFTKTVHTASGWAVPKITAIPPSKISADADYVVSFYAKSNYEASGTVRLSTHTNTPLANSPSVNIPPSESWVKITVKITTLPNYDALVSGQGTIVIRMPATGATAAGNYIQFKDVKLELGNRATDWTPAPEDVDAAIQDQQVYVEYSVNGSTDWHTTFAPGDIYMRQKKGSGAWSAAIRIVGEKGAAGAEGRYTDYQFAKNTSASTAPTSGWQDSPPAISAGEYVWMRTGEVVPPATSPSKWSTATRVTGDKGAKGDKGDQGIQGIAGPKGADGKTYYTWVKYADSPTTGMSDYPSGKAYIGLAHNQTTATESSNYADYKWSLIKGTDGQPGAKGADGKTYYTWIKYANTPTSGMSDSPTGKTYIGIAVNKTTATESSNYADYNWSLIKGADGADGRSVTGTDVEFAQSTSATTAPTTGWQTTAPAWVNGRYIWTRTKTTYSSGSPSYSAAVNLTGAKGSTGSTGATGATGTGVSSITEEYYLSTSKTARTGGSWVTSPPTWEVGKYMWTRVKIVYKNPTSTVYTEPVVSAEWEVIDNIEVGGRNYALNTSTPKTKNSWTGASNQGMSLYIVNVAPEWEVGKQVTIAFDVEVSGLAWSGGTVRLASQSYGNVTSYDGFGYYNFFSRSGSSGSGQSLKTRVVYQVTLTAAMLTNQRYIFSVRCDYITAGSLTIKNFALFYGNKATDWTPAPEDVPVPLEYLTKAIGNNESEINGGLILASVLAARDSGGTVRSYQNGDPALNDIAFAAGVENFGMSNETQNIALKHSGAAKIGAFSVSETGEIEMIDPSTQAERLRFATVKLPSISSLYNGVAYSGTPSIGSGNTSGTQTLTGSFTILHDGVSVNFNSGTIMITGTGRSFGGGLSSYAKAELALYRGSTLITSFGSAQIHFTGTTPNSDSLARPISARSVILNAGTYTFRLLCTSMGDVTTKNATSGAFTGSYNYNLRNIKRQQYGLDGMMLFYSNNHFHFTENGGLDARAETNKWNAPGALLGGRMVGTGTVTNWWGAKVGSGSGKTSNAGEYQINHTIGHLNYFISATPTTDVRLRITAKTNNYFRIRSSSSADVTFDYVVIGNNY